MSDYKKPVLSDYTEMLAAFARYKLDLDCSQNTIFDYLSDLSLFFRYILLSRTGTTDFSEINETDISGINLKLVESITPNEIRDFISYTNSERGNKACARARKLSAVKSFYRYLNTTYQTQYNPTTNIQTPKITKTLPKFLTLEESLALLETVRSDTASKTMERDYAIITLFLNCGMRLSELCGIGLSDIDPKLTSLRVLGKGSKERLLYLNEACQDALVAYLRIRNAHTSEYKDKNALFVSSQGNRINQKTVQWMVHKYLDMAGFSNRRLSTHKLRHTAATLMYQTGKVDVRVLKDILGHEQLNTTQIYTHVSDSQMQSAVNANPLAGIHAPDRHIPDATKKEPEE